MNLLIALAVLVIILGIGMILLWIDAPEGFEDDEGFHVVKK